MDADLGLLQCIGDQAIEGVVEYGRLVSRQVERKVVPQKPFPEDGKLPAQEGVVVARQVFDGTAGLDDRQGGQGVPVETFDARVAQDLQVQTLAQVADQQQATLRVLGQDLRGVQTDGAQLAADPHIASAVLEPGGCVHHDDGSVPWRTRQ